MTQKANRPKPAVDIETLGKPRPGTNAAPANTGTLTALVSASIPTLHKFNAEIVRLWKESSSPEFPAYWVTNGEQDEYHGDVNDPKAIIAIRILEGTPNGTHHLGPDNTDVELFYIRQTGGAFFKAYKGTVEFTLHADKPHIEGVFNHCKLEWVDREGKKETAGINDGKFNISA